MKLLKDKKNLTFLLPITTRYNKIGLKKQTDLRTSHKKYSLLIVVNMKQIKYQVLAHIISKIVNTVKKITINGVLINH
jgi:hypothetical protein